MIFICVGSSMLPIFGKLNLIKVTKQKSYKVNDIVSLKGWDKKYYCHRIQKIDSLLVSTKGDNLEQQKYEKDVPIKNIQGVVSLLWRIRK